MITGLDLALDAADTYGVAPEVATADVAALIDQLVTLDGHDAVILPQPAALTTSAAEAIREQLRATYGCRAYTLAMRSGNESQTEAERAQIMTSIHSIDTLAGRITADELIATTWHDAPSDRSIEGNRPADFVFGFMETDMDEPLPRGRELAEYVLAIDLDPNGYDMNPDMLAEGHKPMSIGFENQVRIGIYQAISAAYDRDHEDDEDSE